VLTADSFFCSGALPFVLVVDELSTFDVVPSTECCARCFNTDDVVFGLSCFDFSDI